MSTDSPKLSELVQPQLAPFWSVPWDFAVHALVGISIFAIIAGAAVLLDLAIQNLDSYGISWVTIYGLKAAEYGLLGSDLWLFSVFLWRTARRTVRKL